MHATRTTAKFLVGAVVATLSGCVAVDSRPVAPPPPPPPPAVSGPTQDVDVAPQIVEGPAREALEAALPDPPPPSPRPTTPRKLDKKDGTAARNGSGKEKRSSAPGRQKRLKPVPPPLPRDLPEPPRSRADVCELGAKYGGWRPDSPQATICRDTYTR